MKIVLIGADRKMLDNVGSVLTSFGLNVFPYFTAAEGKAAWRSGPIDAVVLDAELPDRCGLDLLREMRTDGDVTPTLVLSRLAAPSDRVTGLNAGADDYVSKPFFLEELVARIRTLLRRSDRRPVSAMRIGNITFDRSDRQAFVAERPLLLPARQIVLLERLMERNGAVVPTQTLRQEIYGDRPVSSNALERHISQLRRNLRGAGATGEVKSLRRIGYRLTARPGSPG